MVQIVGPLGLVHKYDISGGKYTCALSVGETGIEPEPPEKEGNVVLYSQKSRNVFNSHTVIFIKYQRDSLGGVSLLRDCPLKTAFI